VELPLTSPADAAPARKMITQLNGPAILVGHSYGGAVITEAGNRVAAFAGRQTPRS
jgi:hypothetical protein